MIMIMAVIPVVAEAIQSHLLLKINI